MPRATLNTSTVEGFKGTPVHPMTPAVIARGIILGSKEHSNILNERNRYSIHKAMNKKAHITLSFKPLMIKLVPSRKVMLVPVSWILYFLFPHVESSL